ncbi:MAG: Copper type ascorbate-dependent monooxygenase [Flavipsychrobacter sp.]|nr:Copper type ascorbate-dependent monooxygenase [Flavipsychrobacter sp.]
MKSYGYPPINSYFYVLMKLPMKKLLLGCVLALAPVALFAAVPDWATKVAPILYNHCTSCHHDGGIAPFSLTTYSDAVMNSGMIKAAVTSKKMPPWPPDPKYSRLAHERLLSATDIATIADWVDGSTPSGSLSLAPPAPVYTNTGMIHGTPDLKVKIPVFTSTASTGDVYQCFVIPSGLLVDKFISSFEAIPGNPAAVHHVLVFADTTGTCAGFDAASPGPGYPNFGGVGVGADNVSMLGVWVPGSAPMSYPNGFGLKLPKNADIVVQVHYPAGSVGLVDSTEVRFFFEPPTGIREVYMLPILFHENFTLLGGPLFIPANTVKTFEEELPTSVLALFGDISMLGAFPHMHLIGRSIKSYGVLPTGDTDKYVSIPDWDFHWQGFYMFRKLKKVSVGTRVRAEATYDNTSANPENPNIPPQDVSAGEATTDEMMIVFFVFTTYQPGDENIIADSNILASPNVMLNNYYHGQQLLDVCPNPAVDNITVKCFMEDPDQASIELMDMQGRAVRQFMDKTQIDKGYTTYTYSVSGLPPGNYTLMVKTTQQILSKQLVVVH